MQQREGVRERGCGEKVTSERERERETRVEKESLVGDEGWRKSEERHGRNPLIFFF